MLIFQVSVSFNVKRDCGSDTGFVLAIYCGITNYPNTKQLKQWIYHFTVLKSSLSLAREFYLGVFRKVADILQLAASKLCVAVGVLTKICFQLNRMGPSTVLPHGMVTGFHLKQRAQDGSHCLFTTHS
jgi:hypothetical protein